MSYGPNPWQQAHWDWRAAGNFIGGGAGSGLLVFTALAGAQGALRATAIVLALALVSAGLLCVWAEIGRPLRAMNVMINPRTSWMSREAAVAPLLMGSGALWLFGVGWAAAPAAVLALVFVWCQGHIVQAAKGIPAWREPLTVPLIVASGLAEGAGLFWLIAPWWGAGTQALWLGFGALLALRFVLGLRWQRRLLRTLGPRARAAVGRASEVCQVASLAPLAIVLVVALLPLPPTLAATLQALAGVTAALGGAAFKFLLITRAGFNQGFALTHLPVRGVRS